jgi:hypothetical protein
MKAFGAICALMLIHGICPEPINPLILHFIIHDCNFDSLHHALIQEWHSTLFVLIKTWLETGPEGSLEPFRGHFASYHDLDVHYSSYYHAFYLLIAFMQQISVLRDRDAISHKALAPEMLYYAIFGSEPPCHPEWKAFINGFTLRCQNGFTFSNASGSLLFFHE